MKKQLLLICALLIGTLSFAQDKKQVVATASIFADMAEVIAGELVDVKLIVPIGGDPHIYEPTPRDAQLVAGADLIIKNGLTFEGWLSELIDNSGTKAQVKLITEGVKVIESLAYKGSSDPHAWMDASNGMIYIKNIKDALVELDPDNSDIYEFNYKAYHQQLEDLDKSIEGQINTIPKEKRILVTSHDAFQYYGRRYGVRLESILGTSTDADVQVSDINRLNKVIKSSGIPAVFIESTVNPKLLKQLATDNHIKIGGSLYSDSIGDKDSPAPTYYDMLKYNTTTIVNALTQELDIREKEPPVDNSKNYMLYLALAVLLIGGFIIVAKQLG